VTPLRVSVAMCTHQGERFLEEQLQSVAGQTHPPDELVICDDASTDETVEIVKRFQSSMSFPVRLAVNEQRLGYAKNFEKAIKLCEGDVIFLADQDDVWYSDKLSAQLQVFAGSPNVGAVFTDGDVVDQRLVSRGYRLWEVYGFDATGQRRFSKGGAFADLLKSNVVTGMTMGFRTSFRDLILPIPDEWFHDHWIALLLAAVTDIAMIPRSLVKYRQHEGQVLGVPSEFESARSKPVRSRVVGRLNPRSAPTFLYLAERHGDVQKRLKARITDYPRCSKAVDRLEGRIRHLRARADIWNGKPRLRLLMRETLSLNYQRYSNGWRSMAADAFLS